MLAMHLAQWVTIGLRTDASSRLLVVAHAVDDCICCSGYMFTRRMMMLPQHRTCAALVYVIMYWIRQGQIGLQPTVFAERCGCHLCCMFQHCATLLLGPSGLHR